MRTRFFVVHTAAPRFAAEICEPGARQTYSEHYYLETDDEDVLCNLEWFDEPRPLTPDLLKSISIEFESFCNDYATH
jgi:hypothetical protein